MKRIGSRKKVCRTKRKPKRTASGKTAKQVPSLGALQGLLEQFQPLIKFHEATDAFDGDDLRMIWDVRIMRGEDERFVHVQGTSSMPRALAPNMVALAPSMIQQEVNDKILAPLVAAMQTEAEKQMFENRRESKGENGPEESTPGGIHDDDLAHGAGFCEKEIDAAK